MKPQCAILLVLVLNGMMTPLLAEETSQSASAAAALTALLDGRKLEAVAAADPDQAGRFIAALYIAGSQLLVVNAPYPVPSLLEKKLAAGNYMDVYLDIQAVRNRDGHFFVIDAKADGLTRECARDEPFDSTSRNGATDFSFDGNREGHKLTEEAYNARFREDDARYARLLKVLAASISGTNE